MFVWLRHCNSDKEVPTFALLDTCSQGTFVADISAEGTWFIWGQNFESESEIIIDRKTYGFKTATV